MQCCFSLKSLLPDHKDTLPSPSAVKVQRCVTPILQTSSIQFRMGCQDTVFMFCALFSWMNVSLYMYLCGAFQRFLTGIILLFLGFLPLNFLIFKAFIYSKFLSVGDLVNWPQGQFLPFFYCFSLFVLQQFCHGISFDEQLFWKISQERLARRFR